MKVLKLCNVTTFKPLHEGLDFDRWQRLDAVADRTHAFGDLRARQRRRQRKFPIQDDDIAPLVGPETLTDGAAEPLRVRRPIFIAESHGCYGVRRSL